MCRVNHQSLSNHIKLYFLGRETLEVQIPDENQLDRRVILGAAMIIIAIEGEQNESGLGTLIP